MDDQDRAARLTKAAGAACGLLLLLLVARSALGDVGLLLVALLALGVVATAAGGQARPREALVPSLTSDGVPDTWRSERWIAEAVERGLRALDEWRWEQRQA